MQGIYPETSLHNDDGKLVGRAHPILKPPSDVAETNVGVLSSAARKTASAKIPERYSDDAVT